MSHCVVHRQGSRYLIGTPDDLPEPPEWLFDPEALRRHGLVRGTGTGRRQALFLEHQGRALVLRHYWRGGMVAVFSQDVYAWTGLSRTRPLRELRLLAELRDLGLPVPAPVAARVCRLPPLGYRGDLLTRTIPGARSLADRLQAADAPDDLWRRVGATVARFHRAGARHADLNVRNILLDGDDRVWLIDWDQGRLCRPGPWRRANLDRLRRSLSREPALDRLAERGWDDLLAGYRESLVLSPEC